MNAHNKRSSEFVKVRRLPVRERKSLGLQPGVGYSDDELTRARYYRMLESVICRETRDAKLTPLQSIGFDGKAPQLQFIGDELPNDMRGVRNVAQSPLDYLFFQAKQRLEFWEWATGKRFEYDWQRSRSDVPLTVNLDGLMLAKVPRPTAEERRRVVTFRPAAGRRVRSKPELGDSRLDAMGRVSRLQGEISKTSFWLLEQIVGQERQLKQVAGLLGADQRYVGLRFREAIWEAAAFYRMVPRRGVPRSR